MFVLNFLNVCILDIGTYTHTYRQTHTHIPSFYKQSKITYLFWGGGGREET